MTRIGTPYFESYGAALRYYKPYHYENNKKAVDYKLEQKEIFIGRPVLKHGEKLLLDQTERRYILEITLQIYNWQ